MRYIEAIVVDGMLKPLTALPLREGQRVKVLIAEESGPQDPEESNWQSWLPELSSRTDNPVGRFLDEEFQKGDGPG